MLSLKRILFAFIILISFSKYCYGQSNDILLSGRNPYVQLTSSGGVAWSTLASQVYYYTPLNPDQNTCIYIVNNNPTNLHTFVFNAFQTGDPNVTDYSHNTGRWTNTATPGVITSVLANRTIYQFIKLNAASKVAFQFTGGSTQAGSPDTVDIYAVQTTATSCVNTSDPCSSPTSTKFSAGVNNFTISASLVAGTTNTNIYVCGFAIQTTSGTTPGFQFAQATLTNCTSPAAITGAYTPPVNTPVIYGNGSATIFNTVTPGNTLCLILSGTTPRVDGVVTYTFQAVQ